MILFFTIFHIIYYCGFREHGCKGENDMPPHGLLFTLIRTCFMFLTSVGLVLIVMDNFVRIQNKFNAYKEWKAFDDCLEYLARAQMDSYSSLEKMYPAAIVALVIGFIILLTHTYLTICQWILYCMKRKSE